MKRLEPISRLLDKKSKSRLARPIAASIILDKFKKVCEQNLSSEIYKAIKFVSYKNNIIKVKCENGAIAQEVKLRQQLLIDKTNRELNRQAVDKLAIIFS